MFATLCVSPSPYLVGLLWYALSCFRKYLYQAFFGPCEKSSKLKEKTKTELKTQKDVNTSVEKTLKTQGNDVKKMSKKTLDAFKHFHTF